MLEHQRQKTKPKDIVYGLYLYFLGHRNTAKALQRFVDKSHVSIWKGIYRYKQKKLFSTKEKLHNL